MAYHANRQYSACLGGIFILIFLLCMGAQAQSTPPASQPSSSAKQTTAQPQPQSAYESATVLKTITRMVVVDIVATDRRDHLVPDLTAADFTVLEDGKEQEVKIFSFQHPTPTLASAAAQKPAELPANIFTNVPRYSANSALNVILLDSLNTTLPNAAYVRDEMLKYLAKIPEGQPVAVYTLGGKLQMLQDFTSDPALLKEAVKKFKAHASPLLDNPSGGPGTQIVPTGFFDSGMVPQQMQQAMQQFEDERIAFQTDIRIRHTLDALNLLGRNLSGYPGRKNLIWISEAFPINIDPDLSLTGDSFAGMRNYASQIAQTADALIDAQVAVYPIDARGLVGSSLYDAANTGRDQFGRGIGNNGARLGTTLSNESAQLQSVHGAMREVAERTGGKAFYNRNDIDGAIRSSIDDGSSYYTLAYYPSNKDWNGKFRKIQVKVQRAGVRLRHRQGYYAVNPKTFVDKTQQQQDSVFAQALNLDVPISTALLFRAGVLQPSEKTENKTLVNFVMDSHAINFEAENDGLQHASVQCVVQAFTDKGKQIKTEATTITAALKPDTFKKIIQQSSFPCQQPIDLPAGTYLLRLGVRDNHTGLIGTANAKVTIAAAAALASPAEPKP